jgi:3-hydroxybutyryl-CoA dehydrogenase
MNILVIGDNSHLEEVRMKFGNGHQFHTSVSPNSAVGLLEKCEVVFDFIIERDPGQIEIYHNYPKSTIFLNAVKINLEQLLKKFEPESGGSFFGFNGLSTFFNRSLLEVSLFRNKDTDRLEAICEKLKTEFQIVDDRVGLVTPRVICMIINEAFYTVMEGTATRDDIDKAMKLGTNYPYGPFEWCERIGIREVYEVLTAVYEDTRDERYEICPLLVEDLSKEINLRE